MGEGAESNSTRYKTFIDQVWVVFWLFNIGGQADFLLRAGLKLSFDSSHPLLRTLTIPSTVLEKHKVEIFLNYIVAEPEVSIVSSTATLSELVVPNLQARESYSGRTSSIMFPVHRTILFGNGLQAVLDVASLLRSTAGKTISKMVQVAANVDWETLPSQQAGITFVNLSKGQRSIRTLRDSLQNAVTYEREWLSSGLPSLVSTVLPDISDSTTLKHTTRDLIDHILDEAESAADASETEATATRSLFDLPESSREALKLAVSKWAEQAHTELRAEMANILESRIWRKLAWWKLFWRIDDVQTIISEAIRRAYLIEAEKSSIFLAGRLAQAGLVDINSLSNYPQTFDHTDSLGTSDDDPITSLHNKKSTSFTEEERDQSTGPSLQLSNVHPAAPNQQTLWPSYINSSRLIILHQKLPPLVSAAQRYVFSALSLSSLTSLASALVFVSISTTTLYEAGSIAALGLMLSAYRLQSKWEQARQVWIRDVQIEGKRALDAVEQLFTKAISEERNRDEDDGMRSTEEEARHAIRDVRDVLDGIDKDKHQHQH